MSISQSSSGAFSRIEVKAGRMLSEGSRVKPDPKLGKIVISEDAQGLTHFQWADLSSNTVLEDYIVFPGESKFVKAVQTKSRVYILELPNHRSFFWMQEDDPDKDTERCRNINSALGNIGFTGIPQAGASQPLAASLNPQPASRVSAPVSQIPQEESKQPQINQEQLTKLLEAFARSPISKTPDLDDIIPPDELDRISHDPDFLQVLLPHLPDGQQSAEYLRANLLSPQLRQALQVLSYAVQREGESVLYSLGLAKVLAPGTVVTDWLDAMIKAFEKRARDRERE